MKHFLIFYSGTVTTGSTWFTKTKTHFQGSVLISCGIFPSRSAVNDKLSNVHPKLSFANVTNIINLTELEFEKYLFK